jgi:hypothetical protein
VDKSPLAKTPEWELRQPEGCPFDACPMVGAGRQEERRWQEEVSLALAEGRVLLFGSGLSERKCWESCRGCGERRRSCESPGLDRYWPPSLRQPLQWSVDRPLEGGLGILNS